MVRKSLVKSITKGSTGLIVCAFLVALAVEYWHAYSLTEKTQENRLNQQLILLSQSLENLLWALDDNSIKLVGDAYMAGTDSVSLKITSSHTDAPVYAMDKPTKANTLYGRKEIIHNKKVIGSIEIGLSGETSEAALLRLMSYSFVLACFLIISLSFIVRLLVMKRLAQPLTTLGSWTDRVASGDYDVEPPPIELAELSSLADKFYNMSEKIQGREKELVKFRDQLQTLVDVQTRELKDAHTELLQRERLATLGELTATVSHELRNPLGTIKTALFAIGHSLEENESYRVNRSLELAERSIERCVNIIEDLNDYARVKKLNCSEANVDEWLQAVLAEIDISPEIDCELELSCNVRASFDSEKLRQVVVNLVSNAIDALQDERSQGKRLQIFTRRMGNHFEIGVSDNGCGMSEEVKSKIFEPLFSTKGFGVGLGLVIVKNIVAQHYGSIHVESKELAGSRIVIQLPLNSPGE